MCIYICAHTHTHTHTHTHALSILSPQLFRTLNLGLPLTFPFLPHLRSNPSEIQNTILSPSPQLTSKHQSHLYCFSKLASLCQYCSIYSLFLRQQLVINPYIKTGNAVICLTHCLGIPILCNEKAKFLWKGLQGSASSAFFYISDLILLSIHSAQNSVWHTAGA